MTPYTENFTVRINGMYKFWGLEVKAEYNQLFKEQNCR